VIFAKFQGEAPGSDLAPTWAAELFDPARPGSFVHFYDEMSRGRLQVDGQALPRRYTSTRPASAYLATGPGALGRFGAFNLEILIQADRDADFGRFDNDGPDGIPNSGDDDGYVDVVFINLLTVPTGFLLGSASGYASLGLDTDYLSDDPASGGGVVRVRSRFSGFGGTTQRGHVFSVTAATMCHEFGHVLGLVDLFDQSSLSASGQLDPEEDSAGVGKWCLMGLGTPGWGVEDGPNAFSAWSLARLGWVEVVEVRQTVRGLVLDDLMAGGRVWKISLTPDEYFLLENRQATGSFYNRNLPASGLLIWHVDERADNDEERHKRVDLVCADGLFTDRGYPGLEPDPTAGRDNLDFWSRDATYATAHNGNQGDAGDPFDGVRYTAWHSNTNPGALAHAGLTRGVPLGIAVEKIRAEGTRMVVDLVLDRPQDGVISRDTTWTGTVELLGDLVVAPGATLTLASGTQVRFASFDWRRTGFEPQRCELLVYGRIEFEGTEALPVSFAPTQRLGQWTGIFLMVGQVLDPARVRIQGARYGVVDLRLPPGVTRWSGSRSLFGDLVIPPESELVVEEGAVVGFAGDLTERGIFPGLGELIVEGRLSVAGSSGRPVLLTGDLAQPDQIWYGIRIEPGGQVALRGVEVQRAGFGINGAVSDDRELTVVDSRFSGNLVCGLRLELEGKARVEGTTFSQTGGQGIWVEGNGRLEARGVTVQESGREGVFIGNAALDAEDLTVEDSGFGESTEPRAGIRALGGRGQRLEIRSGQVGGSTGPGLDLTGWEGEVRLSGVTLTGNGGDGLRTGGGPVHLSEMMVEGNTGRGTALPGPGPVEVADSRFVANGQAGARLEGPMTARVTGNTFTGASGLELEGADSILVRLNRFEGASVGLSSLGSAPRVEANRFTGNLTAVRLSGNRVPRQFRGNLFSVDSVHVENAAAVTLEAAGNYWGTADSAAIAARITGPVTWVPFLVTEPDLTAVTGPMAVPIRSGLWPAFPNPFNGETVIPFRTAASGPVRLTVYDGLGQPVRELVDTVLPAGEGTARWDGRDGRGVPAASGVYLVRLQAGPGIWIGRVVLLR
jgi:M6 family metalloprotease-like protein